MYVTLSIFVTFGLFQQDQQRLRLVTWVRNSCVSRSALIRIERTRSVRVEKIDEKYMSGNPAYVRARRAALESYTLERSKIGNEECSNLL